MRIHLLKELLLNMEKRDIQEMIIMGSLLILILNKFGKLINLLFMMMKKINHKEKEKLILMNSMKY